MKHLKGKAPGIVSLRAPGGDTWQLKLIRKDNALWFSNGWSTFVSDHGSEFGDLFVFKYCGHLRFNVQIFDTSACQKESAIDVKCSQKLSDLAREQKGEKNVNDIDNNASSLWPSTSKGVKRKASSAQFLDNHEVIILTDDSETEERVDGRKKFSASGPLSQSKDVNLGDKPVIGVEDDNEPIHDPVQPGDHFLVKQATDEQGVAFPTGYPLSNRNSDSDGSAPSSLNSVGGVLDTDTPVFVHRMKKYNIERVQNLVISRSFYQRYSSFLRNRAKLVLQTPDGASNTVRLVKTGGDPRCLSAGWSSFIRRNSIKAGDTCVFKFVGGSHIQVHIIKKGELKQVADQIL
ncbi:B3 DNA binding domain [Dillenia turbinata]|uniref:B3 DNA binding domain n=1 Tax=Dillenia turbinata TaxID=194707 RepID=A0AAN8VXI4_9MAGN